MALYNGAREVERKIVLPGEHEEFVGLGGGGMGTRHVPHYAGDETWLRRPAHNAKAMVNDR